MIKWLRKILGINALEMIVISHNETLQAHTREINKHRIGKRSMRYDEIERARSRRKKRRIG